MCFWFCRAVLACQSLVRSAELSPTVGYTKYLMLAQLREGLEAIAVYERAVEILTRDIAAAAAGSEVRDPCP